MVGGGKERGSKSVTELPLVTVTSRLRFPHHHLARPRRLLVMSKHMKNFVLSDAGAPMNTSSHRTINVVRRRRPLQINLRFV